jgi:glycosyltransferase involved in cell wall biosynthesis
VRPLTVAVVAAYYPPRVGGVERYAERIACELRDSDDLRPVVITSGAAGRTEVEVRDGVPVVRLPRWFCVSNTPVNPSWVFAVRQVLRRYDVDVVNTHAPVPFLADVAVLVAGGRPVVHTYHAGSMVKHVGRVDGVIRAYEKAILPRVFRRADALVASSPASLAHRVPGSRIITPGVDTDVFSPDGRPHGNTLLYVGRLDRTSAWKGVDVLLEAFAAVASKHPRARLRIVGSGDALDDHRVHARVLGIAQRVEFTGQLAAGDLVRAYREARMLVLPSRTESESFGMTLIEAMACGRPVVGSAVGGIPSVVEDGRTGLLVPPGDTGALAAACTRLLADDELCAELGARGRHRAETTYAWPALVGTYLDLFRSLAHRRPRAGHQRPGRPSSLSVSRNACRAGFSLPSSRRRP